MAAGIFEDLQHDALTPKPLSTYGTAISGTGALLAIDLAEAGANRISALATISAIAGSGNVTVKIQESDDNVNFVDITGAAFTAFTTANTVQIISFNVSKRYVQAYGTLNSGTSVTAQISCLAQAKQRPANFGGWQNDTYQ